MAFSPDYVRLVLNENFEDAKALFLFCERLIASACGEDVAGRLHTARSRNDIDMTMYRMRLRECVLVLTDATLVLRASLIELASRHRDTVFAAHTHPEERRPCGFV